MEKYRLFAKYAAPRFSGDLEGTLMLEGTLVTGIYRAGNEKIIRDIRGNLEDNTLNLNLDHFVEDEKTHEITTILKKITDGICCAWTGIVHFGNKKKADMVAFIAPIE